MGIAELKELFDKYNIFNLKKEFKEDNVVIESDISLNASEILGIKKDKKDEEPEDAFNIKFTITKRF